jgi:hypothetical protein
LTLFSVFYIVYFRLNFLGVDVLTTKSKGLFIYASMASEKLRAAALERNGKTTLTLEELEEFPEGLDDFYKIQMKRVAPSAECPEWRVVELATAAKEPLHVEMVK